MSKPDTVAEATKDVPLPEVWQPAKPAPIPEPIAVPDQAATSWEVLCAWHGPNGFFERWRTILIGSLREVERAKALASGEKPLSDQRASDRAHQHPRYIAFIEDGLKGRVVYEREFAARGGLEHV